MMAEQSLYNDNARYYDLIYSWKNYEHEVALLEKIITKHKKSKGKKLLDIACGSGQHIQYFKKKYSCTGTDVNSGILEEAKKKLPDVRFIKQDMKRLNTKEKYDVITCLFSSIGYLKTKKDLSQAIHRFSEHLASGGVLIVEPWLTPDTYYVGTPHMNTYDKKDIKIARLSISKRKNNISIMDMHWLVAEKGKEVKHFQDVHYMRMTPIKELIPLFEAAGLKTTFVKNNNRGLIIGVKR